MPATLIVRSLSLSDLDGAGPALGSVSVEISDTAIDADAAAEGAGKSERVLRVRLPRAKWLALLADLKRPTSETLTGALDAACPVARDP